MIRKSETRTDNQQTLQISGKNTQADTKEH